jgi:hypothetical protein
MWSTGRTARRYAYYHCPGCRKVKATKAALEERFLELMANLRPKPSFIRLFHEIVLDVWKQELSAAESKRGQLETRIGDLSGRLRVLDDAYSFSAAQSIRKRTRRSVTGSEKSGRWQSWS